MKNIEKNSSIFLISILLLITSFIYYPGLWGDYVFDDSVNILKNNKLMINELTYNNLNVAAHSGNAGPSGRPISLISFALNYYLKGYEPFYFKLTNLFIHLFNGVLVYLISIKIYSYFNIPPKKNMWMSLGVTLIWLIHPLNLTSVLYVVQRMTSLSTLFGLFAIYIYMYFREAHYSFVKNISLLLAIILLLVLSILSKESGLLFFVLIYWLELIIFKGKGVNRNSLYIRSISLDKILWAFLVLNIIICCFLIQPYLEPQNFNRREFNLNERLLTELRVIFYYLYLFFTPAINELSLYHDDFIISKGLFNPITTFICLVSLVAIIVISIINYKRYPLILFAIGWYLISQLLESTIFSLELVHEHRNYFGTIGFIIAIIYYAFQCKKNRIYLYIFFVFYTAYLAVITWERAKNWSNLVDHAAVEARYHPNSERANYQLARIYMKLMSIDSINRNKYADQAKFYLNKAKKSYLPSNAPWYGELHLYSEMHWEITTQMLEDLEIRQHTLPFRNNNISLLSALAECQIDGYCKVPHQNFIQLVVAGINNPTTTTKIKAELYKLLANYFVAVIADYQKGEEFLNDALKLKDDVNGRLLLAQIYRLQGKTANAQDQISQAIKLDVNHIWASEIKKEEARIISTFDNKVNHEN